jgi:tRNA wybutosine-synthesizing protein 2
MPFYKILRKELEGSLSSKELEVLPRGYQVIGNILILKLDKKLLRHRRLVGKSIIRMFPHIRTVCLFKGLKSATRKPDVEVIAGCGTITLHREHGCQFLIDVAESMWSKGNKEERIRLTKLAKPNETIVDMFAGIGYFSIFLAKYSKPKKLYAVDINPKALEYLRKNAWLNKVESRIEVLEGDCRLFAKLLENTANRIVMGYIFDTEKFLPYALKIARNNCIIHFHRNIKDGDVDKIKEKLQKVGKIMKTVKVKSYSPNTNHYVFDLKITKP